MSGHDDFLDPVEARVAAALSLRLVVNGKPPRHADELIPRAFALADALNLAARDAGWTPRPPFPGISRGLEYMRGAAKGGDADGDAGGGDSGGGAAEGGGARLACATWLYGADGRVLGVALLSLITGRRPQISVGPPTTAVPADWQPLQG